MDDRIVQLARKALQEGKKILIVGVTPRNLGKWHALKDLRLVFWESTHQKNGGRAIPANVGLVVMTRFNDHGMFERLKRDVPSTATFYSKHLSTGELKSFLEASYVLPVTPEVNSTPIMAQTALRPQAVTAPLTTTVVHPVDVFANPISEVLMKEIVTGTQTETTFVTKEEEEVDLALDLAVEVSRKPGVVKAFVERHADWSKPAGAEVLRLLALAGTSGIHTTQSGLTSAYFKVKKAAGKTKPYASEAAAKGAVAKTEVKAPRRDSAKLLAQFSEQAELVGVAIVELLEENKDLRRQVDELTVQLKGRKQALRKALSELV